MTTALAPEPQVITRHELAALTARESEIAQLAAEYMPLKIKREAEEAKQRIIQQRMQALAAVGVIDTINPGQWTEEQYQAELLKATAAWQEKQRLEAEAAEIRRKQELELAAERERLAKIKAEQDAEAARQKAESDRLAEERRQIEAKEAEQRRQAELAKAREEAAERARIETERRLAREEAERKAAEQRAAEEAKAKAEREEQARLKAEAERPHREKLLAVADAVLAINVPQGPQSSAVAAILRVAAGQVKKIAMGPL